MSTTDATDPRNKFAYALTFLEKVKDVFTGLGRPFIYQEFLGVMKEFKTQTVSIHGVVARIKQLFRGHHDLILGFNCFLPPTIQITIEDILNDERASIAKPATSAEVLDHARDYIRRIKDRFIDQPHIYRTFLKILHTYKRERQSVQEVYDKIVVLFTLKNRDLINEFAQFLTGDGHSTEARDEEAKRNPAPTTTSGGATREKGESANASGGYSLRGASERPKRGAGTSVAVEKETIRERSERTQREKEKEKERERDRENEREERDTGLSAAANSALIKTRAGQKKFREQQPVARVIQEEEVTPKDLALFFTDIKGHFDEQGELGTRKWNDLIKVLELYNLGIIGKNETAAITYSLTGECEAFTKFLALLSIPLEKFETFKNVLYSVNTEEEDDESTISEGEYDETQHEFSYYYEEDSSQYTGRTELDKSVLNDHWVSEPPRSGNFKFKASSKNVYEENLFECEDGRFELDVLLARSVRVKETLQELLERLEQEPGQVKGEVMQAEDSLLGEPLYQPSGNEVAGQSDKALAVTHRAKLATSANIEEALGVIGLHVICTLYGDEGKEVLRMLVKFPQAVIPTLIAMLARKELELLAMKKPEQESFGAKWRQIVVANHLKSMDHRGQYWKEQEAISLKAKKILEKISESFHKRQHERKRVTRSNKSSNNNNSNSSPKRASDENSNGEHQREQQKKDSVWLKREENLLYPSAKELLTEMQLAHFSQDEAVAEKVGLLLKFIEDFLTNLCDASHRQHNTNSNNSQYASSSEANEKQGKSEASNGGGMPRRSGRGAGKTVITTNNTNSTNASNSNSNEMDVITVSAGGERTGRYNTFYGDKNLVILARYIEILLDHLHQAWNFEDANSTHDNFQAYLQNLVLLTNRKLDQEAFEEKCIALYGANSYTLFGSSILLDAIVDLVKILVADAPSSELSRKMIAEYFTWSTGAINLAEYEERCSKICSSASNHQYVSLYEVTYSRNLLESKSTISQANGHTNNNSNEMIVAENVKSESALPLVAQAYASQANSKAKTTLKRTSADAEFEVPGDEGSDPILKKQKLVLRTEHEITIHQLS